MSHVHGGIELLTFHASTVMVFREIDHVKMNSRRSYVISWHFCTVVFRTSEMCYSKALAVQILTVNNSLLPLFFAKDVQKWRPFHSLNRLILSGRSMSAGWAALGVERTTYSIRPHAMGKPLRERVYGWYLDWLACVRPVIRMVMIDGRASALNVARFRDMERVELTIWIWNPGDFDPTKYFFSEVLLKNCRTAICFVYTAWVL